MGWGTVVILVIAVVCFIGIAVAAVYLAGEEPTDAKEPRMLKEHDHTRCRIRK